MPNRFKFGYGLSPEIVQVAAEFGPDLLVTVDNGISSQAGVALANNVCNAGIIITDHHLLVLNFRQPLPSLILINRTVTLKVSIWRASASPFLSLICRARRAACTWLVRFEDGAESGWWLDLVALGTIADVVQLDQNNRRLVSEGLRRIRADRARPGLNALIEIAGLDRANLLTRDLAFSIAST